jgi:hypothetical protein
VINVTHRQLARAGRVIFFALPLMGCSAGTIQGVGENAGGAPAAGGVPGHAGAAGGTGSSGALGSAGASLGGATSGSAGAGGSITGAAGTPNAGGTPGLGGSVGAGGNAGAAGRSSTGGGAGGAGGRSTGGTSSGGTTSSAGNTGAGGSLGGTWLTGYVATMFGNSNSGDCSGFTNFVDATNISGATCTHQGVSSSPFQTAVANNASYYGAPGDLATIWQGPQCQCQGGGTGNCPTAPSCPMEGLCGKCVAVKCDPNGAFTLGNTTHAADCNRTSYVVVQIIDACPHNHPTNVASTVGWCTSRQANHIDLSCSALGDISTLGTAVGRDGWLNVDVQAVDCSVGLGRHAL